MISLYPLYFNRVIAHDFYVNSDYYSSIGALWTKVQVVYQTQWTLKLETAASPALAQIKQDCCEVTNKGQGSCVTEEAASERNKGVS